MSGPDRSWGISPRGTIDLELLSLRVLNAWPRGRLVSYVEVADALLEIPWDVLEACRCLVQSGSLTEGGEHKKGHFQFQEEDPIHR